MKPTDPYLKFVSWSEEDRAYVGYCPDLFPYGAVCHARQESTAYQTLCELVREEVRDLQRGQKPLPAPATRPMREVMPALV